MPETLTLDTVGHVLVAGLNRPRKMNAFNLAMLRELSQAYTLLEQDPELRVLCLVAHGDHFTAGLDLAEVGPAVAGGAPLFPEGATDPLDMMEPRRRKPVVCGVQGHCFTIGVELLLASDIRLAARGAILAQMEVQRGILPFGGGTLRWPAVAGWGDAMRWVLTGDRFGAEEALRVGLVSEVVEPGELHERALALAQRVAAQAPLAVQAVRESARLAMERGFAPAAAAIVGQARHLMGSEDAMEGLLSFVERRPAVFKGR